MAQVPHLDELTPFTSEDSSTIRELAHPSWTAAERQSLAEASLPVGGATDEHYHPVAEEIYHFTSGSGRMRLADEEFDIRAGHAVVIPPGTPHKLWNTGEGPLVLLCCCSPAYQPDDTVLTGN